MDIKCPLGLVRAVSLKWFYLLFFLVSMSKIHLSEMGIACYPVEKLILLHYVLKPSESEPSEFDPFASAKNRGIYSNGWSLKLVPKYFFL